MKSNFLHYTHAVICKSLIVLFGLFFLQPAHAQKITPIARIGFGMSDWKLSEGADVNTGVLPSFTLGVFGEINLKESLFMESGLEYSTAGAELKWDEYDSPNYSMGYLNLPVYAKLRLDNGLSFFAGPKAGLLLGAKEKEEDGYKRDVKEAFKNADFSLVWGATYHLHSNIEVGVQITHGFVNVYNDGDTEIRNRGFAIHAGYIFPMRKA
jgi:opacity protein-like surface antigen